VRVATRRGRHNTTRGPLNGARTTVRRWRTGGGALTPSGYGAGADEEGRRRGGGVRCSIGVWVLFYRVGKEAGAAGNGGRRR
jgi:hypothetical protein